MMMHKATPSREETTTKIQTLLLVLGPDMMRSHVYHEMAGVSEVQANI